MQFSKPTSSHDDLPEAVAHTEASTYKYSVPEHSAPHGVHSSKEVVHQDLVTSKAGNGRRWTRWPLLLLYGLLIAIIAGVIGRFIGKRIANNSNNNNSKVNNNDSNNNKNDTFVNSESPNPSNSSSNNSTLARILPIPTTGCSSISEQKYLASVSALWKVDYTTMCGTRWTDPQLTALSAATPSDCIEACQSYNAAEPPNAQVCLGASFVPRWWNQTLAMEQKNEPFNCFLMENNTIINRNQLGFEVVALCLKDACRGLIGG
ncbi:hypothetical protein EKO04_007080 [Ascochyta lentis]|uniref:Uncharacterized protein n=1 Tax=Ascochyta lentis TaxID=205686 RepID=A0A8H7MHM1_9PLEO|nr:hypothetical protein EKO04_007080 [Ascochyta lentis]